MHLVLMTRGHMREVNEWATFMQTIPFNFEIKNEMEGTTIQSTLWGALRPIQLWEYVFPETTKVGGMTIDSLSFVMNTLKLTPEHKAFPHQPHMDKYAWLLRKGLHLEEIPKKIDETPRYPFPDKYVHIWPIGWKKDDVGSLSITPHLNHEKI